MSNIIHQEFSDKLNSFIKGKPSSEEKYLRNPEKINIKLELLMLLIKISTVMFLFKLFQ